MRTTKEWWDQVSNDPAKMIEWLKDQYHGEITASERIANLLIQYPDIRKQHKQLIVRIAADEAKHAEWIESLLIARGIEAIELDKEERYWDKTLPKQAVSFSHICAIGYHAETMRLDRIELLAGDDRFEDIARVFTKILPDELFHAQAFKVMSTPEDIEATAQNHKAGMGALGLSV